jgi:MFS family permease
MGLCYSYFYLLITTLTPTFEEIYHFSPSIVGLSYLGLGVGYVVGQFVFASLSDSILKKKTAKDEKGSMKPEYRLPLAVWGGFAVPIAFFWYGWSAQAHVHWIVPICGPFFLGFGNSLIFVSRFSPLLSSSTDLVVIIDVHASIPCRRLYHIRCVSVSCHHCYAFRNGCRSSSRCA